eukprot:TRINITY_DN63763_c0_g2_i1.p1 TRINITY_DN63763_c0_g2~~TRINITY_DN63763_c0_g2_i1.p1  ORF type:complete len:111 (+),score=28.14 TRINITY_DN63763_c0_g2_i1:50-382(+)
MKHLAAYILCVLGGNESPSSGDVTKIITAAGGEADEDELTKMMNDLAGKDLTTLCTEGLEKIKNAAASASANVTTKSDAEEAPKQAVVKEEEVDALEGGMNMFGGGDGDY